MPCLACWEWWDLAVATVSALGGWLLHKFTLKKEFETLQTEILIKELRDIRTVTAQYHYEIQDPETGKVDMRKAHEKQTDVSMPDLNSLLIKHWEWVVIDKATPPNKRWLAYSLEADSSIQLIREHGLEKAREHKKKRDPLPNPASRFWENQS